MDVTFEREGGKSFSIEVGFFDSFLEVKEKVQKYEGIPVSNQTLLFNGQLLHDHHRIIESQIRQDSRILLRVMRPPPPPPTRIKFTVKIVEHRSRVFPLEMDVNDTVLMLKEKIHEKKKHARVKAMNLRLETGDQLLDDHRSLRDCGVSANSRVYVHLKKPEPPAVTQQLIEINVKVSSFRKSFYVKVDVNNDTVLELKERIHERKESVQVNQILRVQLETGDGVGKELFDHQLLRDCGVSPNSYINVDLKQPQLTASAAPASANSSSSGGGGSTKKLKVMVVFHLLGTDKIPIEVNASDKVRDLRKELEKFHTSVLPEDGFYFFSYKERSMNENMSFQEHNVEQGDTIETFNGFVGIGNQPHHLKD